MLQEIGSILKINFSFNLHSFILFNVILLVFFSFNLYSFTFYSVISNLLSFLIIIFLEQTVINYLDILLFY
jgi:hypothetical protein